MKPYRTTIFTWVTALALVSNAAAYAQEMRAGSAAQDAESIAALAEAQLLEGNLSEALLLYREAYQVLPSSKILANIGIVLAEQGEAASAANAWSESLALDLRSSTELALTAADRRFVESRLNEAEKQLGRVVIRAEAAGPIRIDGRTVARDEGTHTLWVDPGYRRIEQGPRNNPQRISVTVAVGEIKPVTLAAPAVAESIRVVDPGPAYHRRPSVWLGASAIVLFGVGVGYSLAARSTHGDFKDFVRSGRGTFQEAQAIERKADSQSTTAAISFGFAGGAALASTLVWYLQDRRRETVEGFAITASQDEAMASWKGSF